MRSHAAWRIRAFEVQKEEMQKDPKEGKNGWQIYR